MLPNLSEYDHPELYDLENEDFAPAGPFYLAMAQQQMGAVLELGCGTGRMTIPLAQAGLDVTALDVVPAMLSRAREKAGDLPVHWLLADARDYHLDRQFSFIFENGSVFMHMLTNTDQNAFLSRVCEHLAPNGRFVLSLFFPHAGSLENVKEEKAWFSYLNNEGSEVRVSGTETYGPFTQIKVETAYRRWTDSDGNEHCHVAPLALRYTFPQEMLARLEQHGFAVEANYGDWDQSPIKPDSQGMIFVCKHANASAAEPLAVC